MGFYPELDNLTLDQLIERFHGLPLDGPDYATVFYQEVASRMRQHDPAGLDFLLGEFRERGDDTDRLRGILLGLTFPPPESQDIRALLLPYLRDRRPFVVADTVDGLAQLGAVEAAEAVLPLRSHPSPHVRASVMRFVRHLPLEQALPVLREALYDPQDLVHQAARDELTTAILGTIDHLRREYDRIGVEADHVEEALRVLLVSQGDKQDWDMQDIQEAAQEMRLLRTA